MMKVRHSNVWVYSIALLLSAMFEHAARAHEVSCDDLPIVLGIAERRIELGLLKQGVQPLIVCISKLPPDPPPASGYARLTKLLAEAYLRSKDYANAFTWADRCREYLRQNQRDDFASRQEILVVLAKLHEETRDVEKAIELLREAIRRHEEQAKTDVFRELMIWAHLGRLLHSAEESDQLEHALNTIDQKARSIESDFRSDQREYQLAARAYGELLAATGRSTDAIAYWKRFLANGEQTDLTRPVNIIIQVEAWSSVATVHRQLKQYSEEVHALKTARGIEIRPIRDGQPAMLLLAGSRVLNNANHQIRVADFHRRIAEAIRDQNNNLNPTDSLMKSKKIYKEAISQLDAFHSESLDDKDRAAALEIAALLGLHATMESLLEYGEQKDTEQPLGPVYEAIGIAQKLHDRLTDILLPNDPTIYRVKTKLGRLYADYADNIEAANRYLIEAKEYWQKRKPRDREMLVEALVLLSDMAGADSELLHGRELLEEALVISTQDPVDHELAAKVCIRLGRVAAQERMGDEAIRHVDAARQYADSGGQREIEIRALRFKAVFYAADGRPDKAISTYEQILRKRRAALGDEHPGLLGDFIQSANYQLARLASDEDQIAYLKELEGTLALAARIAKRHYSSDHSLALDVRHQQAMLHFLRNQKESNPWDREAARELWQSLLAVQEQQNGPRVDQARTLHYLARLRYLDWSREFDVWMAKYQQPLLGQSSAYDRRLARYDKRRQDYVKRADRYVQDYQRQTKNRKSLQASCDQLIIERNALRNLVNNLKVAYRAQLASKRELAGRLQRDLGYMLSEAETLADRAVTAFSQECTVPYLHYLALCNHAEILLSQSLWKEEANNARDWPFFNRAIERLKQTKKLDVGSSATNVGLNYTDPAELIARSNLDVELRNVWVTRLTQQRMRASQRVWGICQFHEVKWRSPADISLEDAQAWLSQNKDRLTKTEDNDINLLLTQWNSWSLQIAELEK